MVEDLNAKIQHVPAQLTQAKLEFASEIEAFEAKLQEARNDHAHMQSLAEKMSAENEKLSAELTRTQNELLSHVNSSSSSSGQTTGLAWTIPAQLPSITRPAKTLKAKVQTRRHETRDTARSVLLNAFKNDSLFDAEPFVTEMEELLNEQSPTDERYLVKVRKIGFALMSQTSDLSNRVKRGAVTPKGLLLEVAGIT
eukprot:gnl/TRDRNA2_/TRDRNA2_168257_c0_seq1.p1 gnl/TRDRNA2_/TRDRNA2_168257_c0~~gnl/TRDRNA2_/TRDRNA2_168257_c0_seq1.p1  ORF type:complete len:197 (-),score=22.03 gnl/TRDRNA2_/TRDRNA2_168257_c0_seq1:288-878(-)